MQQIILEMLKKVQSFQQQCICNQRFHQRQTETIAQKNKIQFQ